MQVLVLHDEIRPPIRGEQRRLAQQLADEGRTHALRLVEQAIGVGKLQREPLGVQLYQPLPTLAVRQGQLGGGLAEVGAEPLEED